MVLSRDISSRDIFIITGFVKALIIELSTFSAYWERRYL